MLPIKWCGSLLAPGYARIWAAGAIFVAYRFIMRAAQKYVDDKRWSCDGIYMRIEHDAGMFAIDDRDIV